MKTAIDKLRDTYHRVYRTFSNAENAKRPQAELDKLGKSVDSALARLRAAERADIAGISRESFRVDIAEENASGPTGRWKDAGAFATRGEADKTSRWYTDHGGRARVTTIRKTPKQLDAEITAALEGKR